jgi:hypothetical protein
MRQQRSPRDRGYPHRFVTPNRKNNTYLSSRERSFDMKMLSILCIALSLGASTSTAFARAGMGSPSMSMTGGGAFGTSAAAPGTNSLGTALSSDTVGNGRPMKGPLLGTDPAIDREETKVNRMMNSICRGC